MQVSVLVPRSTIYPVIGFDFLDGIRTALAQTSSGASIQVRSMPIGFGVEEKVVYQAAETSLMEHQADVLVVFGECHAAEMLAPLADALGKWLIQVSPGANFQEHITNSARYAHLHGGIAFQAWLTGQKAAQDGIKEAIMATSYFDAGYHQIMAMVGGFNEAGGAIEGNFVSPMPLTEQASPQLHELLAQHNLATTALLLLCSGDASGWFLQQLAAQPNLRQVYANAMALEPEAFEKLPAETSLPTLYGYTAWHPEINDPYAEQVRQLLQQQSKRYAGMPSLLGWETGSLLADLFTHQLPAAAPDSWYQEVTASPRPKLHLHGETQQFLSDTAWLSRTPADGWQTPSWLSDNANINNLWDLFAERKRTAETGGWRNTYLCS